MRVVSRFALCAVLAVGCLFASAGSSKADVQTIRSSNSAIWGSLGSSFINYKEPVTPIPDSQRGWLVSGAAGVSYMTNSNMYFAVEGSVSDGDDRYRGAYYYYPNVPLEATTHETVTNIDFKIGQGFALGRSVLLTPYFDLGYRYWTRELSAAQVEDYSHFAALGGAMVQVSPLDRLVLSAYGAAGVTMGPKMEADGDEYELGSAGIYKVGAKIGYNLTSKVEVFSTLDFDHFRYVKSGVVNGSYEPSSFSNDTAVRFGMAYHFR